MFLKKRAFFIALINPGSRGKRGKKSLNHCKQYTYTIIQSIAFYYAYFILFLVSLILSILPHKLQSTDAINYWYISISSRFCVHRNEQQNNNK